jgi:hypothetical protein
MLFTSQRITLSQMYLYHDKWAQPGIPKRRKIFYAYSPVKCSVSHYSLHHLLFYSLSLSLSEFKRLCYKLRMLYLRWDAADIDTALSGQASVSQSSVDKTVSSYKRQRDIQFKERLAKRPDPFAAWLIYPLYELLRAHIFRNQLQNYSLTNK